MDRSVWLRADATVGDWDAQRQRITAGLEAGVDWIVVDESTVDRVRELGDVNVAALRTGTEAAFIDEAADGRQSQAQADAYIVGKDSEGDGTVPLPDELATAADLRALDDPADPADGVLVHILDAPYETLAEQAAATATYTVVIGDDWTIIPLENLIARIGGTTTLIAGVTTAAEAETAFETLEHGVDGVLLDTDRIEEIHGTVRARDAAAREELELVWAPITEVERAGSADRVCVDTASLMDGDEGMLIGSMGRGLFFVHAETADSPYVASRPFRVNAGAVHAYVRRPDGTTSYLSELQSGDAVQVVDTTGQTREAIVGRVKIERRPMFRLQVALGDDHVETLLQNAETIKVHTRAGPTPVTELAVDDEVLVHAGAAARHFGEAIEETIIER
jgi:3-dehydroquinate synthase II